MGVGYDTKTLTLAPATAVRLSDLLVTEGYIGNMIGSFLELEDINSLGDVYHGSSSSVSSANGRILTIFTLNAGSPRNAVDPSRIWLISATGGDIGCTFLPM